MSAKQAPTAGIVSSPTVRAGLSRNWPSLTVALLTLSILVSISALTHAQQTQPRNNLPGPSPTPPASDLEVVKTSTNLVQIDAVVTDKQGRHVADLSAKDFEIVEGARAIEPEYFSYVPLASGGPTTSSAGQPRAGDVRRVFVFVVSNPIIDVAVSVAGPSGRPPINRSMSSHAVAQRAAQNVHAVLTWFVDKQMTESDLVAIADTEANLGVLSSFTNDRDVLHAAIDQVKKDPQNAKPIRVMSTGGDVTLQPLIQQHLRMIQTLENVIGQVEKLPGRKVVTFLARGMLYNPMLPYANVLRERVAKLITTANRAKIAIYTLQLRDLSPAGGNQGNDRLISIAHETGGRAIYNTNDLRVGFADVMEENRGYYMLAYNPGAEAAGRPHQLQVRVKRPGLKVLARTQAFAPEASAHSITTAAGALNLPYALDEIKVNLNPKLSTDGPAQRILTTCNVGLANVGSTRASDVEKFSLSLSIRITGPDGHLLDKADREVSFEVKPNELETTRNQGFDSQFEVNAAKPGYYRISVAVRDQTSGKVGSATKFFPVAKPQ
jgi:VWFA-related protein